MEVAGAVLPHTMPQISHPSSAKTGPKPRRLLPHLAIAAALANPLSLPAQCPATPRPIPAKPLPPPAENTLHTALDAYDSGNLAAAEPVLRRLSTSFPSSYAATEALGSLLAESSRPALALPLLQRATALAPQDPLAESNLAAALLALNRPTEAVCALRRALTLSPPEAKPLVEKDLGQALLLSNQPAAAAEALSTVPNPDPDLLYNLALAQARSNQTSPAADTLNRIPPPARTDASEALAGDLDERLGRFQTALLHLQAAARQNPSDPNLYALTLELLRHWNWNAAAEVAHFASAKYPSSNHFQLAEGIARYAGSDFQAAVPLLSSLLVQHPEDATVADLLGRSCANLAETPDTPATATPQTPGCAQVYTFAIAHPRNAVMTTYAAAAILHQPQASQNLPEAEHLLQAALAADPHYAPAFLQLGILQQIRLDWAGSAKSLEQAVALQPAFPEAHYRLSRAYAHLGQRDRATAEIALQQRYVQQNKASLDARLQGVVTFLVNTTSPASAPAQHP